MSLQSQAIQRAAAEFIGDRHRLGAFVNGLLRDAHAAEDVIQEVWVRLAAEVEKGTVFENQPAWCRGVAKNLILKHWRRLQTAKVVADSAVLDGFLERVEQAFAESDDAAEQWARGSGRSTIVWRRCRSARDDSCRCGMNPAHRWSKFPARPGRPSRARPRRSTACAKRCRNAWNENSPKA